MSGALKLLIGVGVTVVLVVVLAVIANSGGKDRGNVTQPSMAPLPSTYYEVCTDRWTVIAAMNSFGDVNSDLVTLGDAMSRYPDAPYGMLVNAQDIDYVGRGPTIGMGDNNYAHAANLMLWVNSSCGPAAHGMALSEEQGRRLLELNYKDYRG